MEDACLFVRAALPLETNAAAPLPTRCADDGTRTMIEAKKLAERFPGDFVFGVATASFQIEGASKADGRKPSIWDAFSNMPGRVFERHNGDVACDHYNRLEQDLDLIKSLGVEAYRFSIAWPRVIPEGTGPINEKGLDFYDRLVDGLKARGIKAFATLYHWDLPLALMGDGGWTARTTAYAYQRYAKTVIARIGDRLDAVATFNEPWCSVWLSHLYGIHAPGERNMDAALAALHFTNLAHGLGVSAVRSERADLPVGIVINAHSVYPGSDGAKDKAAAERAFDFHNGVFFGPIFKGEYPEGFLAALGSRMPLIEDGDMATIAQPLDWWGLNYYTPMRVSHDPAAGAEYPATINAKPVSDVKTDIGWEVYAPALGALVETLNARYTLPDCYITENGACLQYGSRERPRRRPAAARLHCRSPIGDGGPDRQGLSDARLFRLEPDGQFRMGGRLPDAFRHRPCRL
ncbi:beta-glucosidase [Sinorhizobium fredii]